MVPTEEVLGGPYRTRVEQKGSAMKGGVPVGRRNILADRRRLAISTLGVGLSVSLIFLLEGLWGGLLAQISAYPDHLAATFLVRSSGARSLGEGTVPSSAVDAIGSMDGVTRVDPVMVRNVILDLHGTKQAAVVIGFDPRGMGGPWSFAQGRTVADGAN